MIQNVAYYDGLLTIVQLKLNVCLTEEQALKQGELISGKKCHLNDFMESNGRKIVCVKPIINREDFVKQVKDQLKKDWPSDLD